MDSKPIWKSRTLWGLLVTLTASGLQAAGYNFGAEDQAAAVDMVMKLIEFGGIAYAAYGRVRASKELTT